MRYSCWHEKTLVDSNSILLVAVWKRMDQIMSNTFWAKTCIRLQANLHLFNCTLIDTSFQIWIMSLNCSFKRNRQFDWNIAHNHSINNWSKSHWHENKVSNTEEKSQENNKREKKKHQLMIQICRRWWKNKQQQHWNAESKKEAKI